MLLNIGNTHTQWVLADEKGHFSCAVQTLATAQWQKDIAALPSVEHDCVVWGACVVPWARQKLDESNFYKNLHWVNADNASRCGIDFSRVDTSTLGADRIANAAALLEYDLPAANFDCGTAVTMEVMLDCGIFAGGAILPGRKLMRCSLSQGTAALPELPLSNTLPDELGVNTLQALALGIDRGAVGMVRELMHTAENYGVRKFLASGGDAGFFCQAIPELSLAGSDFTLRGVYRIAAAYCGIV